MTRPDFGPVSTTVPTNTTLAVVATNASIIKEQVNKLASSSHDGLAMALRPAHTMGDGDCVFALATGRFEGEVDMNRLLAAAALCVSQAIVRSVLQAEGIGGIPSVKDLEKDADL